MAKGIYRKLDLVLKNIKDKMYLPSDASMYARGMRSEGYLGGYRQAIMDVILALSGIHPTTRGLWDKKPLLHENDDREDFDA